MLKTNPYSLIELNLIASLPRETYFQRHGKQNVDWWLWEMRKLQESLVAHRKFMQIDVQMEIMALAVQVERRCRPILNNWFRKQILIRRPYLKDMPTKLKNLVNEKTDRCIRKHSY